MKGTKACVDELGPTVTCQVASGGCNALVAWLQKILYTCVSLLGAPPTKERSP